jgi:uncharacterized protein YndB with AHSA1/START domain
VTDDPTTGDRVVVRRVIAAARERVFRNWTEPDLLKRWWGPGGFTCPVAEVDLRLGGAYRLAMLPPGGVPEMSVTGIYREIDPPARLVYTWRWDTGPAASTDESIVTVEFNHLDDERTEVIVTHARFPTGHDTSPYRAGWQEGLEKLEVAVTQGEANG